MVVTVYLPISCTLELEYVVRVNVAVPSPPALLEVENVPVLLLPHAVVVMLFDVECELLDDDVSAADIDAV